MTRGKLLGFLLSVVLLVGAVIVASCSSSPSENAVVKVYDFRGMMVQPEEASKDVGGSLFTPSPGASAATTVKPPTFDLEQITKNGSGDLTLTGGNTFTGTGAIRREV